MTKLRSIRTSSPAPSAARALTFILCTAAAAFMSLSAPDKAQAEEFSVCVICNDPGKVYQCSLSYEPPEGSISTPNQRGLQFACIQEVARYGKHGQCAASRQTAQQCGGEPYTLRNQSVLYQPRSSEPEIIEEAAPEQPSQRIERSEDPTEVEAPVRVKKKDQKPSLVDTTGETYEATKETVKKGYEKTSDTVKSGYDKTSSTVKKTVKSVGDGIGSAAKTTYNCLTSFFQKCSE